MATSASPPLKTYGATVTTFLTTTISLSSNQASFTILYPPPATEGIHYTTFPVGQDPSSTYIPIPLPILVLTNVVGIAVNPTNSPIATRTLVQTPPSQAINTSVSQVSSCPSWKWTCWPLSKQIGIGLAIGLGTLLLLLLFWWLFFWRSRIKKIRIRRRRPGDGEGGEGRPPLKISVRTSMSRTRRIQVARDESLNPSPPPMGSGGIRVVAGSTSEDRNVKKPPAYKIVRQPSPREFVKPVSMPEGPERRDVEEAGEPRVRDFAFPISTAAVGAGIGGTIRSRSGEGIRVSRGESSRASRGSRMERPHVEEVERRERSERRRECEREVKDGYERRRSRSHRVRDEEYDDRLGERRNRRNSYASRNEEDFEVRRDHSPRQRNYGRDGERRRPRSASPPRGDQSEAKGKQNKRRDSESGIKDTLRKVLPFVPLVLGLMSTIGEPKGGWNQYIPEEKRKKSKVKKIAEDVFEEHHHKIPEDFPGHLHQHSPRSKSADRAYRSTKPRYSPSPTHREDRPRSKNRNTERHRGRSSHPVGNMREAFNSITPEAGSAHTTLTPSPPPRRRRSTRDRKVRGYDGADDEDFVVHSAGTADGNAGESLEPYEISEPDSPILRGAAILPLRH